MEKFNIRTADDEQAMGPYTRTELIERAEREEISPETLYFDDELNSWVKFENNEALKNILFPTGTRLKLRGFNTPEPGAGPVFAPKAVSAQAILQGASANDQDYQKTLLDAHLADTTVSYQLNLIGVLLILNGLFFVHADLSDFFNTLRHVEVLTLLSKPYYIVALIDFSMAALLFTGNPEVLPIVRFRAMLGLGYLAYAYWSFFLYPHLIAVTVGCFALFLATMTINRTTIALCTLGGLGGIGFLTVARLLF